MAEAFTDKGAGSEQLHSYLSKDDLYTNALMKRDSVVLIRNAGGEFLYYIPDARDSVAPNSIINLETGQTIPINSFLNSPIHIAKPPEGRSLSSYGVWARTARHAKESISKGVNFYAVNIDSDEFSRVKHIVDRNEQKVSQSVRQALMEASEMTAKKIVSIDFETGAPMAMEGGGMNVQNHIVLTGAMAETTDYAIHLRGAPDGLSEMRVRESKSREYMDLDTVREWVSHDRFNSETFFRENARGIEYKFGKKNFALLLDAARERRMRHLKKRVDTDQLARQEYARLEGMGSLVEKEMSGKFDVGSNMQEFGLRYKMFRSDLRRIVDAATRHDARSRTRRIDPEDSSSHRRIVESYSIGETAQTSMMGTSEAQITTVDLRLTSNVPMALAEDIAEYSTRTGRRVNAFGSMEPNIFRQTLAELQEQMTSAPVNSERHNRALALHRKVSKALVNVNDVKSLSQLFLHDYLPGLQKMAQDSRTIFDRVSERMGIHGDVKTSILGELDINPKDPFSRGFSLEQLIRTMHAEKGYKEHHVASMDSADLNAYVEALDRIKEGSDKVKRIESVSGNSSKYFQYGIKAVNENLWETSARFASEVNSKTMAAMIMQKMNAKGISKLLKKGGFDVLGNKLESLQSRYIGESGQTAFEVTEAITKIIKNNVGDVVKDLQGNQFKESQRRISMNAEPGFLSRIMSRQHLPRIFAFYAMSQMMRTPGGIPQEGQQSMDHGEHASIATIARRIASTDFGSPVTLGSPQARSLIKTVLGKAMTALRNVSPSKAMATESLVATTRGAQNVEGFVHSHNLRWASITAEQRGFMEARDPTLRMVVDSAQARVQKQLHNPGGYLVTSMRDKAEKQLAYEGSKNLQNMLGSLRARPWERDPNKFALLETTQRVDKHMLSLKSVKHTYVDTPYGDTSLPEHTRMPVENWLAEQQIRPGHTWSNTGRNRYPSTLALALKESASVDGGRKIGSFQKRLMTGLETSAHKQRMGQRELAADMVRSDYSDGMHIDIPKRPMGLLEEVEILPAASVSQGVDVKNAFGKNRGQWIATQVSDARMPVENNIPLYLPEGTTSSLSMAPATAPLRKPKHVISSARFTNRKEKVPVMPAMTVPKAPLEMPVIMPTNVGPAGIAPLRPSRTQAPLSNYHELFTMNMDTRKAKGYEESGQRVMAMAMAGLR